MFSNGGSHELLKLSWIRALVRVHRWHQGHGSGATPPCSCCCPWSQPRDTCNFSPHCFKEGLFTVEKSQTRTFPGLTNGEFSPSLVLTVGSDTAVLSPDLGPKALKLFGYIGLPASLKGLSKLSVKQLKRFIKFSRELQNFKQGYFMCIKWFCQRFFPALNSSWWHQGLTWGDAFSACTKISHQIIYCWSSCTFISPYIPKTQVPGNHPDCPAVLWGHHLAVVTSPSGEAQTEAKLLTQEWFSSSMWRRKRHRAEEYQKCLPRLTSDGGGRKGVLGLRIKGWGSFPLPPSMPCQEQLVPCLGTSPSKQLLTPSPQLCRGPDMDPQLVQNWTCQTRKCPKCLATLPIISAPPQRCGISALWQEAVLRGCEPPAFSSHRHRRCILALTLRKTKNQQGQRLKV